MMTIPRRLPLLLLVLLLSGAIQAQETTEEPIATLTPTATATVEATSTPLPSHTPTLEPSATIAPTNTSTMEPSATPLLTEEITEAPTATVTPVATEEATAEVTLEPTAEVTAEPTAEVTIEPTAEVTAEPPVVTPQKQQSQRQSQPQAAMMFVVNSIADPGDGTCDATECTLREAITAANANSGTDTIAFDIPGTGPYTIQPLTLLPVITDAVIIDGTTESDYVDAPVVELDGQGTILIGLTLQASDSIIRGLAVNYFDQSGIVIENADANTIEVSYIGIAPDGETAAGNLSYGLRLANSDGTTIQGNVISGNLDTGVLIDVNSPNTVIQGNRVGTNAAGTIAVGNGTGTGEEMSGGGIVSGGLNTLVGGEIPAERNIISGNQGDGLEISGSNSTIQGNYIGTDVTGTIAIGNTYRGLVVTNEGVSAIDNVLVGGASPADRNIISGNGSGIVLNNSGVVTVQNNYIGTDVSGMNALGNQYSGIVFVGSNATITGNIIAYNFFNGVEGYDGVDNRITANSIFANELVGDPPENWPDIPSGLGIDLTAASEGATPNDPGDTDTGPNNLQNFPELTRADYLNNQLDLLGTLNSTASTQFRIEFFANNACDPSGYGEGEFYLGFTDATTDGSGDVTFNAPMSVSVNVGQFITATAIDPNGNTSEFSACITVEESTAQTYVINSTADPGDGTCDAAECTLREAITAANANSGKDTIAFDIPGTGPHTIQPLTLLPVITDAVIIDGTTEPDYVDAPVVELNGKRLIDFGLILQASGSIIRGLAVNYFEHTGISVENANNNTIEANYIGVAPDGETAEGSSYGLHFWGASNNIVKNNLISGNLISGLVTDEYSLGNIIQGNLIGTNAAGTEIVETVREPVERVYGGLSITGSNTIVGGETEAERNIISGNPQGVVVWSNAENVTIQGNYIGTDITGTVDLGNEAGGVYLEGASNITVVDNLISGNDFGGVLALNADTVTVARNYIGTDASGTAAIPNYVGVNLSYTTNMIIQDNLVSGNETTGIITDEDSPNNVIRGNLVGTNEAGNAALGNGTGAESEYAGLGILATGPNTIIGGETEADRNVISGNQGVGVAINASGIVLQGNYIGTDVTGTQALGNINRGVYVTDLADNVLIGGDDPAARNVISGNGNGILVNSNGPVTIKNNYIGVDASGTAPLGNVYSGVYFSGNNATLTENIIAYNFYLGVGANQGMNNRITANSIFANELVGDPPENWPDTPSGLGIELDGVDNSLLGVTPNDPGDADTGANNLQNFPELTSAVVGGGDVTLAGTLNSTANTQFRIEFFANNACDASGYGEGETYLGFAEVTTDGSGNALIDETLTANVSLGQFITATAIDPGGNTSEFSACVETTEATPQTYVVNSTADPGDGTCDAAECTLREAITAANANSGTDTIAFDIPGVGPHTIQPLTQLPAITDTIIIDGTTEPDYVDAPVIELYGQESIQAGLTLQASNSVIRGLAVNRFRESGIWVKNGSSNTIEANYLGIALDGETATGDGETATGNLYGLLLYDSSNNTVRGNVISGNITSGVEINENSPDNVIEGNLIGTNASGTAVADYNAEAMSFGIVAGGSNTTIGGETESSRNIISGNYRYGVYVTLAAENVTIQGNYIGTDITGTFALGNETAGLHLDSASNIMVSDNVISGNAIGIWVASSGPVTIDNNYIGTDATGTAPLGNIYAGVSFLFGSNTTLTENIIAYNSYMGVGSNNGMNNRISANRIFANELVGDPPEDWPDTPSGLGIDLYDVGTLIGVTPNDPGDVDTGPNNLQNFPDLNTVTIHDDEVIFTGILRSTVDTQFRIEFFANNACDASGYGEGETYLGFAEVTTDGSGNALIDETLTASVSLGQFITATAIDPGGNTSEFSACVEVEAGPLTAPTDLVATAESSTVIGLSWTDTSSDETGFSVERSLNGSDGWTEIGTTAADGETYTDEGLTCETEYFYRVRAVRDSDVSDYSNTDSATTLSCLEVALRTPRDGSATTSTRPNFRWQRNRDADRYRFELATDEDFTTLVLFSETPNNRRISYRVPRSDALSYGVYYWRVLADSGSGSFVPASEVRMLTVTPRLPRPPRQADPRNNARLNDPTPTLSWEAVSGAGDPFTYEIEIDNDARFRSPEISASVDGLSYSPASDLADGRWYWRVRAVNYLEVETRWSGRRSFIVDTVSPEAPQLQRPNDGSSSRNTRPVLRWKSVREAKEYRIQVSTSSDFTTPLLEVQTRRVSYRIPRRDALAAGTYYWQVQARDAAGNWSTFSSPFSFSVR